VEERKLPDGNHGENRDAGISGPAAVPGQDRAADVLRPTPVLAALTEQAVSDAAVLTDDQLIGALRAVRTRGTRPCRVVSWRPRT
jgi:hypothetical protein